MKDLGAGTSGTLQLGTDIFTDIKMKESVVTLIQYETFYKHIVL